MAFEFPRPLEAMGKWIADNKDVENIIYVIQTGDIVENGFAPRHWENFDLCYNQFRDILPYFPIAGNHDVAINRNDYAAYLERPFFAAYPPENLFEGGKALYTELHAGGLDFLLLGAGWNAELDATEWMNQVLAAHPDHTAILLFHGYINADGGFTVIGKKMYEQVVLPNPNVKLVLCGHCSGTTGERVHEIDDDGNGEIDRKVYALMYNFQNQYEPNSGQLCKVLVDPIARTFRFTVYSPYSGRFHRDHFHRSESFLLQELF